MDRAGDRDHACYRDRASRPVARRPGRGDDRGPPGCPRPRAAPTGCVRVHRARRGVAPPGHAGRRGPNRGQRRRGHRGGVRDRRHGRGGQDRTRGALGTPGRRPVPGRAALRGSARLRLRRPATARRRAGRDPPDTRYAQRPDPVRAARAGRAVPDAAGRAAHAPATGQRVPGGPGALAAAGHRVLPGPGHQPGQPRRPGGAPRRPPPDAGPAAARRRGSPAAHTARPPGGRRPGRGTRAGRVLCPAAAGAAHRGGAGRDPAHRLAGRSRGRAGRGAPARRARRGGRRPRLGPGGLLLVVPQSHSPGRAHVRPTRTRRSRSPTPTPAASAGCWARCPGRIWSSRSTPAGGGCTTCCARTRST
jgi:hypothetical protein